MRIGRSKATLLLSNGMFAILSATLIMTPLLATVAIAEPGGKPVAPNPEYWWPENTFWGTELLLSGKNAMIYGALFGARAGSEYVSQCAIPPGDAILAWFLQDGQLYCEIVRAQQPPPQSYTWYVEMSTNVPQIIGISADLENATHDFVPSDFSVVLENQTENIFINLRVENGLIDLTHGKVYATLYIGPPAPPVGGIVTPVNKLALLAPWIILVVLITIASVSVAVYWRRRKSRLP